MELRLEHCTLRPWRKGDEPALVRYADNRKIWRNLFDAFPHPYGLLDATNWVARHANVEPTRFFAIEHAGELAGSIAAVPMEDVRARTSEIGYWIAEPFWGRGLATEAVRGLTSHAFEAFPELVRIQAAVFGGNVASMRVLEKAGYEREAVLKQSVWKDGQLLDSWLYARLRDDVW